MARSFGKLASKCPSGKTDIAITDRKVADPRSYSGRRKAESMCRTCRPALVLVALVAACCCVGSGCVHTQTYFGDVPSERLKVSLPPYVIDPPDVLVIDAIRLVPKPPYRLMPFDEVGIRFPAVPENLAKDDFEALAKAGRLISGTFTVEPEGSINLGPIYGRIVVADLTVEQARVVLETRLMKINKKELVENGKVFMELTQFRGMQQIRGEHLVRPDGTVSLGIYGSVPVAGLTLLEAKLTIEAYLTQYLEKPEISVDVAGYNSHVYYVIFDGAGYGEQVFRLPVTGKETVLDAIGQVNGLPPVAWKHRIFVARPTHTGEELVLPVDWKQITRRGSTETNYQLLPGDRLYVQAEPWITTDTYLGRFLAPFERAMGFTLLGTAVVRSTRNINGSGGNGSGGGF
jgi:polysaccharide biosynthesis/export protein